MNMRWTDLEKAIFRGLWGSGKPVAEIAATMGKSQSAVKNQRVSLGLPARRTGDLTSKVRIGLRETEFDILYKKSQRHGQSVPARVRQLILADLAEP